MKQPNESNKENLLLKIVIPKQGRERKVKPGGSEPKAFRPVTISLRNSLSRRLKPIEDKIATNPNGAIPIRIELVRQASAKSHRPNQLFNTSCPIIAAGSLGEIFVKATTNGIKILNHKILNGTSKKIKKEISSINTIEAITSSNRLNKIEPKKILKRSPKKRDGFSTKVQLFDYGEAQEQDKVINNFKKSCEKIGVFAHQTAYSYKSMFYEAICKSVQDLENLSKIDEIRNIQSMPVVYAHKIKTQSQKSQIKNLPVPTIPLNDYPLVAVVDSGTDLNNNYLKPWVVGSYSTVAPEYHNTEHGTSVSSLICFGKYLNPTLKGIESYNCAIFDVQVLPNDDPNVGDVEEITEPEFLDTLENALKKHSTNIKVWNLSIGTDSTCSMESFSSLAIELDRLQEEYNVIFVISAGNYNENPLLNYPRAGNELQDGRITSPADSALGITVGAISHINHEKNGPKINELSSFSRHGAGPNHIIKPDFVHYGGSCSIANTHHAGINSLVGTGSATVLGTSFSAPLVSRTLAKMYHSIIPSPSNELLKALITHHAKHPKTDDRVPDEDVNFVGFGLPASIVDTFYCDPWSCTLVFEDALRPGYFLEWDDFPYPDSLIKDGKYFGDISMTIALTPYRNAKWGTEYCETHIDAKFGLHNPKKDKKGIIKDVFRSLVPPEHKNPGILFESYQVSELRKWAPVRTYFGRLNKNGTKGHRWRLKVQLLCRHENENISTIGSQKFALVMTITDPTKQANIYDEMVLKMRNQLVTQNIQIKSSIQLRTQI